MTQNSVSQAWADNHTCTVNHSALSLSQQFPSDVPCVRSCSELFQQLRPFGTALQSQEGGAFAEPSASRDQIRDETPAVTANNCN